MNKVEREKRTFWYKQGDRCKMVKKIDLVKVVDTANTLFVSNLEHERDATVFVVITMRICILLAVAAIVAYRTIPFKFLLPF